MWKYIPHGPEQPYTQKVVLYHSNFEYPEHLKTLVPKSWNIAVLGNDAANIMAGELWYTSYFASVNAEEFNIQYHAWINTSA